MNDRLGPVDDYLASNRLVRERFIAVYCAGWGAVYKGLIPVTNDLAKLVAARTEIQALMRADFDAYQRELESPWVNTDSNGEIPFADKSKLTPQQLIELGLFRSRAIGMPAPVKPLCEDHPDVVAARQQSTRTAEYAAHEVLQVARKRMEETSSAFVAASNANDDADLSKRSGVAFEDIRGPYKRSTHVPSGEELAKLKSDYDAACAEVAEADAVCRRLRLDLQKALKLVK